METLRNTPVAAFCSYGNQYLRFISTKETIGQDVEQLLALYGAQSAIRQQVQDALAARRTFSSGFHFEEGDMPERTVVYATNPNPYIDNDLKTVDEFIARSAQHSAEHQSGLHRRKGSWSVRNRAERVGDAA